MLIKICNVNLKPENTYTAEIEEKENPRVRGVRFDVRYDSIDSNTIYRINFEAQRRIYKNVNFNTRKFLYATKLYSTSLKEGSDLNEHLRINEIFFIKSSDVYSGSPVKVTKLHNIIDDELYDDITIYEFYIDKIIEIGYTNKDYCDKMIVEMLSIFSSNDVKEFKNSKYEVVRKVADCIMKYTDEEIKELVEYNKMLDEWQYKSDLAAERREGREEALIENIKTMSSNGFSSEMISKALSLDIEYVNNVLEK